MNRKLGATVEATDVSIRRARPEDAPMLAALAIEVWLQTYAKQGIPALYADHVLGQYTIAAMTEQIEAKSSHVWVASNIDPTLGDALLGYLVWEEQATAPL